MNHKSATIAHVRLFFGDFITPTLILIHYNMSFKHVVRPHLPHIQCITFQFYNSRVNMHVKVNISYIGLGYVSRKKSQRHGLVDFGERLEIEIRKDHPFANGP